MRMAPGFARQGLKVVIPGPLSDQQRLGYVFRSSKEHREDLQALMAELKRQSCLSGWPPAGAMELDRQLQGALPVELIQLEGESFSSHSKHCSPLGPHGFGGQEKQLMKIITAWMNQSLNE